MYVISKYVIKTKEPFSFSWSEYKNNEILNKYYINNYSNKWIFKRKVINTTNTGKNNRNTSAFINLVTINKKSDTIEFKFGLSSFIFALTLLLVFINILFYFSFESQFLIINLTMSIFSIVYFIMWFSKQKKKFTDNIFGLSGLKKGDYYHTNTYVMFK